MRNVNTAARRAWLEPTAIGTLFPQECRLNQTIEQFLASVERRALRMVQYSTGSGDEALDIVQDAMIGLVRNYRDRPPDEWPPLFYRILQSRMRDWQRRNAVRRRWQALISAKHDYADADYDPWQDIADPAVKTPSENMALSDGARALEAALLGLPARQRQAFLLRAWEGLDVSETAIAMSCSEGSVKTHYSRAVHCLRELLEDHWG